MRLFAKDLLILSLLDLIKILKEEQCVFRAIMRTRENVPSDTRRTAILHILIAEEYVNVVVFESNDLLEALILSDEVLTIEHAIIITGHSASGTLKKLGHLLLPHVFIVRVEVYLDVSLRISVLMEQESLFEEFCEGDQRWGPHDARASPLEPPALTIIAQSVVEIVIVTHQVILARVLCRTTSTMLLRRTLFSNVARRNEICRCSDQSQTCSNNATKTESGLAWDKAGERPFRAR